MKTIETIKSKDSKKGVEISILNDEFAVYFFLNIESRQLSLSVKTKYFKTIDKAIKSAHKFI